MRIIKVALGAMASAQTADYFESTTIGFETGITTALILLLAADQVAEVVDQLSTPSTTCRHHLSASPTVSPMLSSSNGPTTQPIQPMPSNIRSFKATTPTSPTTRLL